MSTPAPELPLGVEVRALDPADEPGLQAVFADSADYFQAATGAPAGPAEVQSLYYGLPVGADPDTKRLLVVLHERTPIGVVDAILHYPHRHHCAVGLFLIRSAHRRRGTGTAVARFLMHKARAERIRSVAASTPASWDDGRRFLRGLGFTVDDTPRAGSATGNRNIAQDESPVLRAELHLSP